MRRFYFYLAALLALTASVSGSAAQTPHYSRDNVEKIDSLYQDVPAVKTYEHIEDFIIELDKPSQNLARKAKTEGIVVCLPLIDEQANVEAIYLKNSVHPMLDSTVVEAIKIAEFRTWREVTGRSGKYALLLHFPFYRSQVDLPAILQQDSSSKQNTSEALTVIGYDKPPEPVGGFAQVQKNLEYPELARSAGISGKVVIMFVVDDRGNVGEFEVVESLGFGTEEAAIEAIRSVQWRPAERKGKPVTVLINLPVWFKIK